MITTPLKKIQMIKVLYISNDFSNPFADFCVLDKAAKSRNPISLIGIGSAPSKKPKSSEADLRMAKAAKVMSLIEDFR